MKARTWNAGASANGFNGKRKDDEVKGSGNQYDYGFRIYDPRLGKFLSVDPLYRNYAFLTPYQFASNNPIKFIDLDGLEATEKGVDFGTDISIKEQKDREIAEKHRNFLNQNPLNLKKGDYTHYPKGKGNNSTNWHFDVKYPPGKVIDGDKDPEPKEASHDPFLDRITPGDKRPESGDIIQWDPGETKNGTFKKEFHQSVDEEGNPIPITYEIGVLNPDGSVADSKSINSNGSGSIEINYELKEGQTLYSKELYGGIKKVNPGGSSYSVEPPKDEPKSNEENEPEEDK